MASRFIVHFTIKTMTDECFDWDNDFIAETAREAESMFRKLQGNHPTIRWIEKDNNPLSPDEEKKYYDKKREEAEERDRRDYNSALADLRDAKSRFDVTQTSNDFELLRQKFSHIIQVLSPLSSSLGAQTQIEECETYCKQCEEKRDLLKRDETLSQFNTAKTKVSTTRMSYGYGALEAEFSSILQVLTSLPASFGLQPEIDECENCRKQCEEKKFRCKKDEILSQFNTAKTKKPAKRTADEYGKLEAKFENIGQELKSLPSSFGVSAEIKECEAYRKKWEQKKDWCCGKKERKKKRKKLLRKIAAILAGLSLILFVIGLNTNPQVFDMPASLGSIFFTAPFIISFLVVFFCYGWVKKSILLCGGIVWSIFLLTVLQNIIPLCSVACIFFIVSYILAMICPRK